MHLERNNGNSIKVRVIKSSPKLISNYIIPYLIGVVKYNFYAQLRKLRVVERAVKAAESEKLVVRALLGHSAVLDDEDEVGIFNCKSALF